MRTVSADVISAISKPSRQMKVRATITQMRSYFSTLTYSAAPAWAPAENDDDYTRYPSRIVYEQSHVITLYHSGGKARALLHDQTSTYTLRQDSTYVYTKSMIDVRGAYIYWKDTSTGYIKKATVNWLTLAGGNENCLTGITNVITDTIDTNPGALHVIDDAVMIFISCKYGGFYAERFYNDGTWHRSALGCVFSFPTHYLDIDDPLPTYHTGAVALGTGYNQDCVLFATSPENGAIMGARYDYSTSTLGDSYEALQSDLSEFRITTVMSYNSKVLIAGQFARDGLEIQHDPVAMLLISSDQGKTFSIDQYSLISKLGWRFATYINNNILYAGDMNHIGVVTLGAAHGNTSASSVVTTNVITLDANSQIGSADATINLKADDEVLAGDSLVVKLNRCKIEIGYMIASGSISYEDYDTYIIDKVSSVYADGVREFVLYLVQEGIWRLSTQTPPFYTELLGKSARLDEMEDYSNMFASGVNNITSDTGISFDLWGAEKYQYDGTWTATEIINGGGVDAVYLPANGHQSFVSMDLKEKLGTVDYPVLTTTSVTISLDGWARGMKGTTPTVGPYLSAAAIIERSGEELRVLISSCSSTYQYWGLTYPTSVTGSAPVTLVLSGLQIGDKLKKIIMLVWDNTATTAYYWYIVRIFISSGLSVTYDTESVAPWEIVTRADPEHRTPGFHLPGIGRYIMLSSKPYAIFDGGVTADFVWTEGDTPTTTGEVAFGIVLAAEDARNCLIVRYRIIGTPRISWTLVRDGVDTVVKEDAVDLTDRNSLRLYVKLKHNVVEVYYFDGNLIRPIIADNGWEWTALGSPQATTEQEGLHVGIYGEISPANFRCSGFSASGGNAIQVLVHELSLTNYNNFPSSGKCIINDYIYSYTGKTSGSFRAGPYQLRSWYTNAARTVGGVTYPAQVGIDIRWFWWLTNSSHYEDCKNYILSSDDGSFNYIIDRTDWMPVDDVDTEDDGPMNRSMWQGDTFLLPSLSTSTRMYVGPGLTGVKSDFADIDIAHPWGSRVYQYGTDDIACRSFTAFTASSDLTVKDMINISCRTAGATPTFSGDETTASISLTSTPTQII